MTDLLLDEKEQSSVRAILASESIPGAIRPGGGVLQHVARLIGCDAIGVARWDDTGYAVEAVAMQCDSTTDNNAPAYDGPVPLGIQQFNRDPAHTRTATGLDTLTLGVRTGPHHVVQLWMNRREGRFSGHERALLALVAPALERLLREPPTPAMPPSLTVQERRVLQQVAAGFSNADIAERMSIAPCTVRKHLENAYRKLGVTNRLAAVVAFAGGPAADPGRMENLARFA